MRGLIVVVLFIVGCKSKSNEPASATGSGAAKPTAPAPVASDAAAPIADAAAPIAIADPAAARVAVWTAGNYGYVDGTGKLVIAAEYDTALPFHEGRACVVKDKRDLVIDETGKTAFATKGGCSEIVFEGGVSTTSAGTIIDKTGKVVARPMWNGKKPDALGPFSDGLAAARFGAKWGFIDHAGKVAIEPKWGPAEVWKAGPDAELDPEGNPMEPNDYYDYVRDFSDGMAPVREGDKWGYIDKTGKLVVPASYAELPFKPEFKEGLASVMDNGKYGWIDKTGAVVIPAQFDEVTSFSEGLAGVRRGDHWEYIDKQSKTVITLEPAIQHAASFSEGLGMIRKGRLGANDTRFCFVDKTGKVVIPCDFKTGGSFSGGVVKVSDAKGDAVIDRTGKRLWPQ